MDLQRWPDTTPYKIHCGGYASPFNVEVGPDGMMAAGGNYMMAPDQVARSGRRAWR